MNPDRQLPVAERDLTPQATAQIRTELFTAMDEHGPTRRWTPYAAAAAVVGLAAGGVLIAQSGGGHTKPASTPTASASPAAAPIDDPAWQRRATQTCYQGNTPLPGGEKTPGHRHSDMRFLTARSVGRVTYVLAGSPAVSLLCTVDVHGKDVETGWGDAYTGDGPRGMVVPAGHVSWRTGGLSADRSAYLIAGQAGSGVHTVRVQWSNGSSVTARVQNGYYIGELLRSNGPLPYQSNGASPAFTITGYDKDGHVTQTKKIPAQPPVKDPGPKPMPHK